MLRNLTLDELRAVRASLPKFRNDQKRYFNHYYFYFLRKIYNYLINYIRQIDWVESLESKIELVSKEPPKKPPAVKKAPALKACFFFNSYFSIFSLFFLLTFFYLYISLSTVSFF